MSRRPPAADTVIARSDSLQERNNLPYTPSAARPIGSGTTAVVADARLSEAFQGDMTKAENSTLAVQQFLAQSLTINLQEPDHERNIVVAPQRMPSASQAQSMAQAIKADQDSSWSESEDLAAATKAKPDPEATTRVPSSRFYPSYLRKQQLPQSAFQAIQDTQNKLTNFQVILSDPSRVVTPFGRAMDRQMSTSWRGRPAEVETYRDGVADYLTALTKQVRLIEKSEAKLSGRSATIPVTVQNNLVQGVEHLVLRLTSTNGTRLKIGDGPYAEHQVKVAAWAQPVGEVHHHLERQRQGPGLRPAVHGGRSALRRCGPVRRERHRDHSDRDARHGGRRPAPRPRRVPHVHPAQARRRATCRGGT